MINAPASLFFRRWRTPAAELIVGNNLSAATLASMPDVLGNWRECIHNCVTLHASSEYFRLGTLLLSALGFVSSASEATLARVKLDVAGHLEIPATDFDFAPALYVLNETGHPILLLDVVPENSHSDFRASHALELTALAVAQDAWRKGLYRRNEALSVWALTVTETSMVLYKFGVPASLVIMLESTGSPVFTFQMRPKVRKLLRPSTETPVVFSCRSHFLGRWMSATGRSLSC
jgi:hypothetical protein